MERFEAEDLLLEQRITDIHLIPGKPLAICSVKSIDPKSKQYQTSLWSFSTETGEARRFTYGQAKDECPRWSPDGKQVAFLSDRSKPEVAQIHLMPIDGGEARQLSHLERGASSLCWHPLGDKLLAVGSVTVDPNERAEGCQRGDGAQAEPPDEDAPQLCWRLPYKLDGTGYILNTRLHMFLVEADTGKCHQLTQGDFDVHHAAWAPDGQRLCFCRTREQKGMEHCTDIWTLPIDGTKPGKPKRMSVDQENCASPSWSPDGKWIVFSGAVEDGDAQMRLWLIDFAQAKVQALGDESIEVMPGDLQWNRDSNEVAFIQVVRGLQQVAVISVPDGHARCVLAGDRHVAKLAANETLVYSSESAGSPLELFCTRWDDGGERQLSHFNSWWKERSAPRVEYRRFELPDGRGGSETVDGWLLRPDSGDVAKSGPLLVDVHGGPASYVSLQFSSHPYWQVLCSRGWSVLALNTVGSSSYGRDFSERLRGHWGELDLPQHLAAIDQLVSEGLADQRVAIAGISYGGYLSAYAVGHSERFRAAVICAPVANMESHFGTSDSGYFADAYSTEGEPTEQHELLARLSPMSTIAKVRTPCLFLQGTDDERCPRGQSEELFVKLRRAEGAPTEMVLYPGGSHQIFGTGKPSYRVDIQHRIVEWVERWIDGSNAEH